MNSSVCMLTPGCLAADNTWALQSWCKKKFAGMETDLDTFFRENGLTEDLDHIA